MLTNQIRLSDEAAVSVCGSEDSHSLKVIARHLLQQDLFSSLGFHELFSNLLCTPDGHRNQTRNSLLESKGYHQLD